MLFRSGENKDTLGVDVKDVWIKIKLFNTTRKSQTLFLHQDLAYTFKNIEYFELNKSNDILNKQVVSCNSTDTKEQLNGADAIYKFTLHPQESKTIYIHQTTSAYHFYNFSIFSEKESTEYLIYEKVDAVLLVGLLLALALYNFLIFLSSRYKEYLYYTLYLLSSTLWIFYMYGSMAHYFQVYGGIPFRFNFGLLFNPVFLTLFVQAIFNTKTVYKREHKFLNSIIIILLLNFIFALVNFSLGLQILSLTLNYSMVIFLGVAISIYLKGNKIIKIFLCAHVFYLVFNVYGLLFYMGMVDFTYISSHAIGIGIIIEALILSYLVSYKFKIMNKEKEEARIKQIDLKIAKHNAESANKAKSEFFANMSHEIRTPMNAVIGFTDLLASIITDKKQKNYLNSIQVAGKSLLKLINDILDLSKIEAGKLEIQYEAVNPLVIINEIKQIFTLKTEKKGLDFIIETDKSLPLTLILDEARLRQILLNLVGNAVKFTDSGYIKLSVKKLDNGKNHNKLDLEISIIDTGIGIPSDQIQSIFESFTQQEGQKTRRYGGTGLGLTISRRLMEMMNGEIDVVSTVGQGSCFKLILREVMISTTAIPIDSAIDLFDLKNIIFDQQKVLVVDDVEPNRRLVKEALSQTGLKISEADNGEQAILVAKEFSPDLILMDIRMPVLDGYEATKKLKADPKTRDIPIIALTASILNDKLKKIEESGFDSYILKPFNLSELFNELYKYLKHSEKDSQTLNSEIVDNSIELHHHQNIENRSELLRILDSEIIPEWEKLKGVLVINDIEEFARKLSFISEDYNLLFLRKYSNVLSESVQSFDTEQIEHYLNKFPGIYDKIKGGSQI